MPFQGTIVWLPEVVYSYGSTGIGYLPSDKVYNVKMDWGDTFKGLRGFSEPSICGCISTPSDPTLHIEWVTQEVACSLASTSVTRTSTMDLPSLFFDIGLNTKGATKSYYKVSGAKCKTLNLKSSTGNEYVWSADYSVCSITQATTATLTVPARSFASFAFFNKVGNVIGKDGSTALATIVDSIDITINNNLVDYWDHDSPYKQACIPGALDVSGTVGISGDDGGKVFTDAIYNQLTNIVIDMGLTTYDVVTLSQVRWDNNSIEGNTANEGLKIPAKFTAKTFTIAS